MLEDQREAGMILIGVSGRSGSGKDAFSRFLVEEHGFNRYAFGNGVKEALYALNPAVGINQHTATVTFLKPLWDAQTGSWDEKWDKVKQLPEVRRLLQRMGTEVGREIHGPNVWVDAAFRKMLGDTSCCGAAQFVISDVRFRSEADSIREEGGYVIRIERPDLEPLMDDKGHIHVSETDLDDYPYFFRTIVNDSSLANLGILASVALDSIKEQQ